jgi:hypothetical protein
MCARRVAEDKSKAAFTLADGSVQKPSGSSALLWTHVELTAVELQQSAGEAATSAPSLAAQRPGSMSQAQALELKHLSGVVAEAHSLAKAAAGSAKVAITRKEDTMIRLRERR